MRRYRTGDRVASLRWNNYHGTVLRVRRGGKSLGVRWDGTSFEDEAFPHEVRPSDRPAPRGAGDR